MDNNQFVKLITKYLSKEATLKEIEELNIYLQDAEYKALFELINEKWGNKEISGNPAKYDLGEGLQLLRSKINKYQPVYRKISTRRRYKKIFSSYVFRAAASIAFITLLAYGAFYLFFSNRNLNVKTVSNEETTAAGQKSIITLTDGTIITLNAESHLKYPVNFENGKRLVELTGEAYFEVAHDSVHPFTVVSGNVSTTALGTKFNVKAYPEENVIAVSLVDGKVKVENKTNVQRDNGLILTRNEQLRYNLTNNRVDLKSFDFIQTVGWKDNILVFKNEPLINVITVLKRSFGVQIELNYASLNSVKVTANFKNESFWTIINSLKAFTKLEYRIVNKGETTQKVIFYKK